MTTIEERYDRMTRNHNVEAPPPEGVVCDCETSRTGDHFHVRCMVADCDECGESVQEDFFVYTKAAGHSALAAHCRGLGWSVDEARNYYVCPKH